MKKYWNKFITYINADKRVFARGLCKEKYFFIFVFMSIFGCLYEEILFLVTDYIETGNIVWETKRGLIYGELSPVYGLGAMIFIYLFARKKRKWYVNYFYGCLVGGGFEYIASFVQEKFAGTLSWDYSNHFMNINGRTTIPFMLVWGLMGLLILYVIYPLLSKAIESIPYNLGKMVYKVLVILINIDVFISYGAAIRQGLRNAGYKPYTPLGDFFDHFFPNEKMAEIYRNAIIKT